jgi:hypothetical protein
MVRRCGLNRLNQFATFLAGHLRAARQDAKLLSLLRNLDEVLYSGLPLPIEEEEWAYRNGIMLRVRSRILQFNLQANPFPRTFLEARNVVP